jgi:lysozyme family protein
MATWSAVLKAFSAGAPAPTVEGTAQSPSGLNQGAGGAGDGSPQRQAMGAKIFDYEAEYNSQGDLEVVDDPPDDGGIREVAGITVKYDGPEEARLEQLVKSGQYAQARTEAINYILNETDVAEKWVHNPGIEFFMRDCVFNRGATGALKILQKALDVKVDGDFGPITEATEKATESDPAGFLSELYSARVWYEEEVVGERDNLQDGLMNRFAEARDFAKTFIDT